MDYLISYTQKSGVRPFGLCVLIGGFNDLNEPVLFSSEPSGFYSQWKSTAIGKNADKVKETLEAKFVDNLEYKDAIVLLLETMLEYVEAGSKNIEIALMYHGKQMQTVSDEEIDGLTQHIEAEKKKNQSNSQANR